MMKLITFLLFGVLPLAGLVAMVRIQRAEYFEAREIKRKREARLAEFSAKCFRPDGD